MGKNLWKWCVFVHFIFPYSDCETGNTSLTWFYGDICYFNVNRVNFYQEQCTVTLIQRKLHSKNRLGTETIKGTAAHALLLLLLPVWMHSFVNIHTENNTRCSHLQCETGVMFQAVQGMWSAGMGRHLYSERHRKQITGSNKITRATKGTWMNVLHALLCIAVHPKRFTIMWGGLSSTTTSVAASTWIWLDPC